MVRSVSLIVTELMVTSSLGLPDCVPRASMAATTSRPSMTLPNREYWGGRRTPLGPLITKNWLPLVFGPALAMAREPELVAARFRELVFELVARAARPRPGGVAALEDETRDHPVEDDALVVVVPGQEHETVDGLGRRNGVESNDHGPLRRDHLGGVALVDIYAHRGRPIEALELGAGPVGSRAGCGHTPIYPLSGTRRPT